MLLLTREAVNGHAHKGANGRMHIKSLLFGEMIPTGKRNVTYFCFWAYMHVCELVGMWGTDIDPFPEPFLGVGAGFRKLGDGI